MYFLGQAANLRGAATWRHTFAFGTKNDSANLKKHLAERYGAEEEDVVLWHTGRTALAAGLKAVLSEGSGEARGGRSEKPGVLVTALTCYAVVEAVKASGAEPVFADVDPETLHYDGKTLEAALEKHKNVRVIVVQNNLGHPCKIKEIEKVAKKHGLPIIEDLAHCAGISYANGREAGTVGVATMLSFGKGKSIDTISGGALVWRGETPLRDLIPEVMSGAGVKKPKLSDRLRDRWYPFFGAGIRALYRAKLGRLYTSLLLKLHFIRRSADADLDFARRPAHWQSKLALRQLKNLPENRPPLREFFFVKNRDEVLRELEQNGFVMGDTWYDTPVAPDRYFKKARFREDECPVATRLAGEIVNLPTFYPRPKLQPARKIIEKYQIKEGTDA